MKIVFITRESHNLSGARIRCYNFASALSRYKIEAEVLSFPEAFGAKDGQDEASMGLWEKLTYNYLAFKKIRNEKEACFCLQRFNYHSLAPYLVHLIKGNKMILDLDDWEMRENPRSYFGFFPSSKAHYFIRQVARRSVACIAASRFLQTFLSQFNKRVYYLPTGVDTEVFAPAINKQNKERMVFSWIGTFNRKEYLENISLALECFKILREKHDNIFFEIVGGGTYRADLTRLIAGMNDKNILLKEWIVPEDVPEYLKTVDVGLLPVAENSKFNQAKSPTKIFEYMATGKPTVSSGIGEAMHIIKNGENGFLARTKRDFIEKMQALIENKNLSEYMGSRAREDVQRHYSLKVLGQQLYEILKNLDA